MTSTNKFAALAIVAMASGLPGRVAGFRAVLDRANKPDPDRPGAKAADAGHRSELRLLGPHQ